MIVVAAALALVPLALFLLAYRADSADRIRKLERAALLCALGTCVLSALDLAFMVLALFGANGGASVDPSQSAVIGTAGVAVNFSEVLVVLALPILPLTAWLCILVLRRSRAGS